MSNDDSNKITDPIPQSSLDERLDKIQQAVGELLAGQKQILSEINLVKSDQQALRKEVNERYVDLRDRIELNNDKLDVVYRELRQFIRDTRNPSFTPV
jgi:septation ring formation regulator EzrA